MNRKFVGFSILGMFLASLLGAGLVYAANGGPSAVDRKQLGLFSGNGDFIGTVLDARPGIPSFGENAGTINTVYSSSLDSVITLFQTNGSIFIPIDVSGSENVLLYFDGINCSGNVFIDTNTNQYVSLLETQVLFTNSAANRNFVVNNSSISSRTSLSDLDGTGICTNRTQIINSGNGVREVNLPFTLIYPLSVKSL